MDSYPEKVSIRKIANELTYWMDVQPVKVTSRKIPNELTYWIDVHLVKVSSRKIACDNFLEHSALKALT
jgi:hypothetical protein